ncbi:MAG: hypothetical protein V2G42_05315 [bacterium JZ-2024 1]
MRVTKKYFLTAGIFIAGVMIGGLGVTFVGAGGSAPDGDMPRPMPVPSVRPMPMGGPPPAGITVSGGFVYILLGNTVYKLDASDLKIVSQRMVGEPGPQPMTPGGQPPH